MVWRRWPRTAGSSAPTLAEVYREHAAFVWRQIRRLGVEEAAAEDVMQEVFVIVHRRLAEYDGRAAMTTWLYHLTRGVVSNYRRGRQREARRIALVERPFANADPEEQAGIREAAEFVRAFVATLDEDKRRIFELVELDGLSVTQAAEIAEVNVNTAHSRLRAARLAFNHAVRARGAQRRTATS